MTLTCAIIRYEMRYLHIRHQIILQAISKSSAENQLCLIKIKLADASTKVV